MNLHDQDTFLRGKNEGIQLGIQQGRNEGIQLGISRGIAQGRSEGIQLGISRGIQQGRTEGIAQGRFEGSHQKAIETAKIFLTMGLNIEQVVKGTGLPRETVTELAKEYFSATTHAKLGS